jgi:beta-glucosidase
VIRALHSFPAGFGWGAATSSHQVEGDNRNSDFWAWEQEPNRIVEGGRSGKACDWWGGRWQEDFDRAVEGAQNVHRLSLEWSRIEPEPGRIDRRALEVYRAWLSGALARGLKPMVTLHHFTNPLWFLEQGGWLGPQAPELFQRYVETAAAELGDLVEWWITINEPNVYAYSAYSAGVFPPGGRDLKQAVQVLYNMVVAHARAYAAIRRIRPGARIGLAHHFRGLAPKSRFHPLERLTAGLRHQVFNETVARAVHDGRFRVPGRRLRIPEAAGTQDFFGLNYYTREIVAFDPRRPGDLFGRSEFPRGADLSPTGFIANSPRGFWEALVWARRFRLPIWITENGIEDDTDRVRPRYLAAHLRQLWRAVNLNWEIQGYLHWTLVDNFEWERGWSQRFGLWELDPQTQERRKRASADFYADICRRNGLSSEAVERFAPEVVDDLFPRVGMGRLALPPPPAG